MIPNNPRRGGGKPRTIAIRKDNGERLILLSPAGAGEPVVLTLCDAEGNLHLLQPDAIRIESIGRKSPAELLNRAESHGSDGHPQLSGFTDRARRVLRLAQVASEEQAWQKLSSQHLLAGLIDERNGVGPVVLRDRLKIDLEALRAATQREESRLADAPRVIEASRAVARRLAFDYVGTEVLLIALATTEGLRSAALLAESGVDAAQLEHEILDYLGRS